MRKQLYELELSDLKEYPIWEFSLDEEGTDGQDEETVRPHSIDTFDFQSTFICLAKFTLADGTVLEGYVSPERDLEFSQPLIYIQDSGVVFWFGIVKPTDEEITEMKTLLGGPDKDIFPIKWETPFLKDGIPHEGLVDGFNYLNGVEKVKLT